MSGTLLSLLWGALRNRAAIKRVGSNPRDSLIHALWHAAHQSESTRRLTDGYFEFRGLGAARVKGVSEPVEVYEVVGIGPLRTKLELAARRGLTRFVGRQAEMAQLEKAFGLAKSGRGQIVGIIGEPGIGKSRLVREFELTSQRDCLTLETFAVSHGKSHPYLPLIDLLGGYFRIAGEDDDGRRREKIAGKVASLDRPSKLLSTFIRSAASVENTRTKASSASSASSRALVRSSALRSSVCSSRSHRSIRWTHRSVAAGRSMG